jgi:hypothetical protein
MRLRNVDCGLRIADCGLRIADCGMFHVEHCFLSFRRKLLCRFVCPHDKVWYKSFRRHDKKRIWNVPRGTLDFNVWNVPRGTLDFNGWNVPRGTFRNPQSAIGMFHVEHSKKSLFVIPKETFAPLHVPA